MPTKRWCDEHQQDYELMSNAWRCRPCSYRYARAWRERNNYKPPKVTPEKQRQYNDKNWYGLTPEESSRWRSITACQVCGSSEKLCIDHDHETGEVRGVLCTHCNLILGHAHDDPDRLRDLARYLEK